MVQAHIQNAKRAAKTPVDPKELWPTRAQAAAKLGISSRTIRRRQQTGELHPEMVNGIWRFNPEELDNIDPAEDELEPVAQMAKVFDGFNGLLKQAHGHIQELLEPNREVLALLLEEKKIDRARITELEVRHYQMLEAAEKIQQIHAEREAERMKEEAKQRRIDAGMHMLLQSLPAIQSAIQARIIGQSQSAKIVATISALSEEQIAGLTELCDKTGFMTPEQLGPIIEVWKSTRQQAPVPEQAAE